MHNYKVSCFRPLAPKGRHKLQVSENEGHRSELGPIKKNRLEIKEMYISLSIASRSQDGGYDGLGMWLRR